MNPDKTYREGYEKGFKDGMGHILEIVGNTLNVLKQPEPILMTGTTLPDQPEQKPKASKHRHIPHADAKWKPDSYECVCGFKTDCTKVWIKHINGKGTLPKEGQMNPETALIAGILIGGWIVLTLVLVATVAILYKTKQIVRTKTRIQYIHEPW